MAQDRPDLDAQDMAEVFDEDNLDADAARLSQDDEELNFDDMPDVYDATSAVGDEEDDDAVIGEDLDDEEIVALSTEANDIDEDDDDFLGAESLSADDDEDEDEDEDGDVALTYAGDLNTAAGAHSSAQRYESRTLSDGDLAELGYAEAPAEPPSFEPAHDKEAHASQTALDRQGAKEADQRLDEGLKETFPASDPVAVKHIT